MKILELRFSNLNSLAGTWSIDFTNPSFTSSGLFVITGQTGSGKTTILDAICLALYGQTPRLGKVTKSSNQIMSKNTGECSAEVVFESQKGKFICNWSQQRARRKPDGELQQPRHEITDADTGKILATKIADVQKIIEEKTGMKYGQFTRSILLAQGSFAAFLQASADDRAPILEQITGTNIYTLISKKVHERHTKEQNELEEMRKDLARIQVLTKEEEEALRRQIEEFHREAELLTTRQSGISAAILWHETINRLKKERADAEKERELLFQAKKEFEPKQERLDVARKAAACDGLFERLLEKRKTLSSYIRDRDESKARYEVLKKAQAEAEQAENQAKSLLDDAEKAEKTGAEIIQRVRELDYRIHDKNQQIETIEKELNEYTESLTEVVTGLKKSSGEREKILSDLKRAESYIEENSGDAILLEIYHTIESHIKTLAGRYESLGKKKTDIEKNSRLILSSAREVTTLQEKSEELRRRCEEAETLVSRLTKVFDETVNGESISSLRDTLETEKNRLEALKRLREVLSGEIEKKKQAEALSGSQQRMNGEIKNAREEIEKLAREIGHTETGLKDKREKAYLAARVRDLEEERTRLIDGSPCPLCGAIHHPYTSGSIPSPDMVEQEVKALEELLGSLQKNHSDLVVTLTRREGELKRIITDQEAIEREIAGSTATWREQALDLHLDPDAEERTVQVTAALELVTKRHSALRELVLSAEKTEEALKGALLREKTEKESFSELEKRLRDAGFAHHSYKKEETNLQEGLNELNDSINSLKHDINRLISPLGISVPDGIIPDTLLISLKKRRDLFQKEQDRVKECEKKKDELDKQILKWSTCKGKTEEDIKKAQTKLTGEKDIHSFLTTDRKALFGEKDPVAAEQQLSDAIKKAKSQLEACLEKKNDTLSMIRSVEDKIRDLSERIENGNREVSHQQTEFLIKIQGSGFVDEEAFQNARLPDDLIEELELIEERLCSDETKNQERVKISSERLMEEEAKSLTPTSPEELISERDEVQQKHTTIIKEVGGLNQRLSSHEDALRQQGAKIELCTVKQKEADRWSRLHDLIGSADGKKFRIFAQGLTFKILLSHANNHLKKMTDRYILVPDLENPLDMQVIDTWQAGVVRSVKNLSGGEMFIVSLALALGLSGMASQNVRVDSLFLDEGFGTLDEEALDTALSTLSGLQQDGKLIGVISHVAAMHERISTRIIVEKGTAGRSKIVIPE